MKRRLPSIGLRGKLALSIAFIVFAALALTYVAVYRGTGSELRQNTESELERDVESISGQLAAGPQRTPEGYTAKATRIVASEGFGTSSKVISVSVAGGGTASNQPHLLGLSSDDNGPVLQGGGESDHEGESESEDDHKGSDDAHDLLDAPEGYSSVSVDDVGEVRVLTRSVLLSGGNLAKVSVGQPLAPVDKALEGFSDNFLVVGLIALLVAAGAGWLLASSTTKPMRRMSEVAEGVDGGDLTSRMPISETRNDEVRRLAESFNGMLDRLEDAFNRQRTFVADASHDLRTPLTIVQGQLEVLARDPDPSAEDVRRVSAVVAAATTRMNRLVDDLLLLAKAESVDSLQLEPCSLQPLIEGEIEGFRETTERNLETGSMTDTEVLIDRERMARVISNLTANAIAHTDGTGTVRISATDVRGGVEVSVEDDGPGVPPAMREKVFDRFARLDASRSSSEGGSGLGLAIVKAIAEAHGGSVRCRDSDLGGADFVVFLPVGT